MKSLKTLRIRPLFQNVRGDLISRISAVPIFRGIKFCGNLWIWPITRNPPNLIPAKFNPNKESKCPCVFSTWPNWRKEEGLFGGRGREGWCKVRLPQKALNSYKTKKASPLMKFE